MKALPWSHCWCMDHPIGCTRSNWMFHAFNTLRCFCFPWYGKQKHRSVFKLLYRVLIKSNICRHRNTFVCRSFHRRSTRTCLNYHLHRLKWLWLTALIVWNNICLPTRASPSCHISATERVPERRQPSMFYPYTQHLQSVPGTATSQMEQSSVCLELCTYARHTKRFRYFIFVDVDAAK